MRAHSVYDKQKIESFRKREHFTVISSGGKKGGGHNFMLAHFAYPGALIIIIKIEKATKK